MEPKRIHLANESGSRSRCRYSSRPSRRVVIVQLAAFLELPHERRCVECQKKADVLKAQE